MWSILIEIYFLVKEVPIYCEKYKKAYKIKKKFNFYIF